MKQDDGFYNVQMLLNFIFMAIVVAGTLKLLGMDDTDTLIGIGAVIAIKIDLLRYEFNKIGKFVAELEIEE